MQFQVPQFIEVEDKIFGPLTLKQFLYLGGSVGVAFLLYKFIPSIYISAIPMLLVLGLGAALAFYKVNGRPFIDVVESAVKFYLSEKLYVWKKTEKKIEKRMEENNDDIISSMYVPRLSDSKLKDMTWKLDIKENAGLGVAETMRKNSV